MEFTIKKAVREKVYTKIALMGTSGSGKTYSALRIATGMKSEIERMTGKPAKILMANTEMSRGRYYANEFDYDICDIDPPHNPEKYVQLINYAVSNNYDILIIDSSSHEWEGIGGCLELQKIAGGTAQSWAKVTPRHNAFINAIAESKIHLIATMRAKDQYEIDKDNQGKTTVKKIGVGAKQRDGFEFEFTCTLLLDQATNTAESKKDNTHIFEGKTGKLLDEEDGKKIIKWANSSAVEPITKKTEPIIPTPESAKDIHISAVQEIIERISGIVQELPSFGMPREKIADLIKENCTVDGKKTANYLKINTVETAESLLKKLLEIRAEIVSKQVESVATTSDETASDETAPVKSESEANE